MDHTSDIIKWMIILPIAGLALMVVMHISDNYTKAQMAEAEEHRKTWHSEPSAIPTIQDSGAIVQLNGDITGVTSARGPARCTCFPDAGANHHDICSIWWEDAGTLW